MASGNNTAQDLYYTYNYSANLTSYPDGSVNRLRSIDDQGSRNRDYLHFEYDNRGSITNNSFNQFTYNRANQMVSAVSGSTSNQYRYDGHNRRVKQVKTKPNGDTETEYSLYSQKGTLLYRETPDGPSNYIYLGKKLIAKDGYFKLNAGKQHYQPFGGSIEGELDDIGYTGHKFDQDIGLSYMQARYYDPVIGRFLSNDPVDTLGHLEKGNPVHGFGRYTYANNNPYKYVDPDGKAPFVPALIVGGRACAANAACRGAASSAARTASRTIQKAYQAVSGALNESSEVDDFVDDLKDRSEPDANSGKNKIRTITDGTTVDDAFDDFPGEEGQATDGSTIKTAEDGTTAHIHSSSKDNGKKTLNIKKPGVKKPIKFREAEAGKN